MSDEGQRLDRAIAPRRQPARDPVRILSITFVQMQAEVPKTAQKLNFYN